MTQFTKEEKEFLTDTLEEFIQDAKDVEEKEGFLAQNLARYIQDEGKVEFLEDLKKKIKNL